MVGDLGLFIGGLAALVASVGYMMAQNQRWSYRTFRREKEWQLARIETLIKLRPIPDDPRKKLVESYREALDRLDALELRFRALEGPEPSPPKFDACRKGG